MKKSHHLYEKYFASHSGHQVSLYRLGRITRLHYH